MATFLKRGDKWQAQTCIRGRRKAKTFDTKAEARRWALAQEAADKSGFIPESLMTFADLQLVWYEAKGKNLKSPSVRYAVKRAGKDTFALRAISTLTPKDFDAFMESEKARGLKPGTIYSKLVYYSSVLSWAVSQGWLKENPLRKVKFPRSDPHRTRIPTEEEYQRLCAAAHWKDTEPPVNSYQRTVAAFRFSMLTGMRKGEIVKIERSWIDGSVIHLPAEAAKTAVGRTVAMGAEARRLLGLILSLGFSPCIWGINTLTLPGEFIKLKRRAGIHAITDSAGRELQADLHFHDARAYFCTWAASPAEDGAPRLSPMELARQLGHSSTEMTMRYYRPDLRTLADRLK